MQLPKFLADIEIPKERYEELSKHVTGWHRLNKYLRRKTQDHHELLELMVLVLESDHSGKEMMLNRLVARRHKLLNQEEKAQIEFYLEENK
jgi:hypothetical protein